MIDPARARPGSPGSPPRLGVCSVTLRSLPAEDVAAFAAAAGLESVEWGADVHAPPGRQEVLRRVAGVTEASGLRTCSYGSYWRAGTHPVAALAPVARAAVALGAPRIRVWAGTSASADATATVWSDTVRGLRAAAEVALDHDLCLGIEFHDGTLADTPDATLRLLKDVGHDAVTSYWQPPVGVDDDEAVAGLARMLPVLSAVHAFSWWPGRRRRPLDARADLWRRTAAMVGGRADDVLLEFVTDDDPNVLAREAASLRRLLGGPGEAQEPS